MVGLATLGIVGLSSVLGGGILGGLLGKGGENEQGLTSSEYSPTSVFAPTYTDASQYTDARQDARTMVYQPSIIIESPNAISAPRTEVTQDLVNRINPMQTVTPSQEIAPIFERTTTQEAPSSGIDNKTLMLGALIVGAIFIIPNFIK